MKFSLTYLSIFIILTLVACGVKSNEQPLASVYDKQLYWEDISTHFVSNLSSKDSLILLKKLINNWVIQQVKINEAKNQNVSPTNLDKLVDQYRNDLLVFELEKTFINNNLDTTISENEMKKFFDDNKENFTLSKNIVKLIFIKTNKENEQLVKLKKWVKDAGSESIIQLQKECDNSDVFCFLNNTVWLDFNEVTKEIPIKTYNTEHFLQNNRYIEISDANDIYLVHITDFKIKNSLSEFEFEKENIKKIIINERKNNLLKKYESQLLEQAFTSQKIVKNIND